MNGTLDVLNCGAGHLSIKFDKANEAEVEKARRMLRDMLKRGYALFAEIDGQLHRIKDFDSARDEYILKDPEEISGDEPIAITTPNPIAKETTDAQGNETTPPAEAGVEKAASKNEPLRPTRRGRRAPLRTTRTTGVAPTAGG